MAVKTQDATGYYVWEVAGRPVVVHLHLDVVDHLLAVVLRGLGALPKRGAEVGGVLLGTVEAGDVSIVRIEDFEPVECEYTRGPSYLFTDADRPAFESACERWKPGGERASYAVGYYRSHTREGMALAPDDVELADKYFSSPASIVLLVKPFRTKLSTAGFFIREDGAFPPQTRLEFPFRRSDLAGEEAPQTSGNGSAPNAFKGPLVPASTVLAPILPPAPAFAENAAAKCAKPGVRNALWIPLSFVFLLVGLALGLMLASARGLGVARPVSSDPALGLSVTRSDENISVTWDRQSNAIRRAQRGTIEIEDGGETVSRSLDAIEIRNGSLIYRNASNSVKFRLTVFPGPNLTVSETAEWRR
jgi:hypothetical protein